MIRNITDVHTHYDESVFDADRDEVLRAQQAAGVCAIISSGSSVPSSERALALAHSYEFIHASVGVFPLEAYTVPENWLAEIERMARDGRTVAVGEIGLDYHRDDGTLPTAEQRACQQKVFTGQLELARRLSLPVIIHDREADQDVIALLKEHPVPGMIHRFFSAASYGFQLLDMGLSLGIGPAITYDNAGELIKVVKAMPMERLLLETDCPFLAPAAQAGQRATSDMIAVVCETVAEVRGGISAQQVADTARENARRMFSI